MMNKEVVQQQFGAAAAHYVTSKIHAKGASLTRLVELVKPQSDWHALDIATGAGHTALAFAPHVAHVTATDITPEMLEKTAALADDRNVKNLDVQYADAEDLPFEDSRFDLVTCRIAPHHFLDVAKFVLEAARVLKPAGALAVADNIVPAGKVGEYVNMFEKLRDPSHGRCLHMSEWTAAYESAGLTVEHVETLTKTMAFEGWARRMTNDEVLVKRLHDLLINADEAVQQFLQPDEENGNVTFQLQEGVFIGRKSIVQTAK
ncbi:MAG: class I SAM-dependent methyltransferase [Chloroflexi bacterium]|nr:class I SAM-dependent methyltransferase [Chloroflexota bacterium]